MELVNMKQFHANNLKLSPVATSRLLTLSNSGLPVKLLIEKLLEDYLQYKYDETKKILESR